MNKVAILSFDGVPFFELGCAVEVFALPRPEFDDWYDTHIVTFDEPANNSTAGLTVVTHKIDSLDEFDMLIVPGWPVHQTRIKVPFAEQITGFYEAGKRIVAFCSGTFLLAQLGLLNNRKATTHWRYEAMFRSRFPQVLLQDNVLYTEDTRLYCSAGSAAGLDLSLEIVRQDFGHRTANAVARRLVIPPHRKGGQSQYVESPMPQGSNAFSETLDWAIANISTRLVVDDLAGKANMSRRSFDRHFRAVVGMSPKNWLNQQRIALARDILEQEAVPMESLARRVGFDNAITLRFNFNKYVGVSPSQYQQQFSE